MDTPPSFTLPAIWDDDDAMYTLMQPIKRPKLVDPETYNHKITFWTKLLSDYTNHQRVAVFSIASLKSLFSRDFPYERIRLSPMCLHEVCDQLMEDGLLKSYEEPSGGLYSLLRNSLYYVTLPVWLMTQHTMSVYAGDNKNEDNFFVLSNLAVDLTSHFISQFNAIKQDERILPQFPAYSMDDFEACLVAYFPHETTRNYIRKLCLYRFQSIRLVEQNDSTLNSHTVIVWVSDRFDVKMPNQSKSTNSLLAQLVHIKSVIQSLEAAASKLSEEIENRRLKIKKMLADKKSKEAMNLLRRTKILEKSLSEKQAQLHNMEAIQMQLSSTSDNQSVLHALSVSSRVLKETIGGDVGIKQAEDTVANLHDVVQDTNEISDLISTFAGNSLNLSSDQDQLESELNQLLEPKPRNLPARPIGITEEDLEAELDKLDDECMKFPEVPSSRKSTTALTPLT